MAKVPHGDWRDAARWLEKAFPRRWGDPVIRQLKSLRRQVCQQIRQYEAKHGVQVGDAAGKGDPLALSLLGILTRITQLIRDRQKYSLLNTPDEAVPKRRKKRSTS